MKKIWFKKKRFGLGWRPVTWEGWAIIVGFVAIEVWNFMRIDAVSHSNSDTLRPFIIQTFLLMIVLVVICYSRSEK